MWFAVCYWTGDKGLIIGPWLVLVSVIRTAAFETMVCVDIGTGWWVNFTTDRNTQQFIGESATKCKQGNKKYIWETIADSEQQDPAN